MKLAEALIQRANDQKRIEQLKQRILRNALVQEGDEPAENPLLLVQEVEQVAATVLSLVQRINRTNSSTPMEGEGTIADAIARRDNLRTRSALYGELASAATVSISRYSKTEIKYRPTVSVADVRQRADALAREFRELDAKLQGLNWAVELVS